MAAWGLPVLFLIAVIAAVLIARAQVQDDRRLQTQVLSIASQLHAPGDESTITVDTSTLDTAQHMRYEIQEDLLAGMSRQQILGAMQKEYGKGVLAAPAVQGFGSLVWIVPWLFLALLVGGACTYIARRAARRVPQSAESPKKTSGERDTPEYNRLRDYL